jgi:hypothetical protein
MLINSNRLVIKSSFPGCSKRALPAPRLRQAGRCKLSFAKSRLAGASEILRGEAYLAVRRNDEGPAKGRENAADDCFSATS